MSLNNNYLQHITSERTRVRDAVIPVEVKSKPQAEKLCTRCHRSIMKPYLQPNSRFVDENGYDNSGYKVNSWYWLCSNIECNHKELMPTIQEGIKKGYRQKNPVTSKLPMFMGTYDRISQSWDKRRKRKGGLGGGADEEDMTDISNWLGYRPESVDVVNSAEYTYSDGGFH